MLRDPALSQQTQIVIYTGDSEKISAADTLRSVKDKFFIDLCKDGEAGRILFVHIKTRHLLEGARYKRFTMLLQSLGSILVGLECLSRHPPDVFFDTMGAAFTYPIARLVAGCRVLAYVHYPIISQVRYCTILYCPLLLCIFLVHKINAAVFGCLGHAPACS